MDLVNRIEEDREGRVEPPATLPDSNDREEVSSHPANRAANDDGHPNPTGRRLFDNAVLKTRGEILNIGTWNVRTLYRSGKLDNAVQEMNRMSIDILGLSEVRWTENGIIAKDKYTMIYSGGDEHKNGVGIILGKRLVNSIIGYWPVSDRIIMVKIRGKPFNVNIIQVYAPTQDHAHEEIEAFYEKVENVIQRIKSGEVTCIIGDFNAKVGTTLENTVGRYGLGDTNERGERLIEFCQQHTLVITNTWFQQHPRRLYTWQSPDKETRNQIDYIMINSRFKNGVRRVKTYPGADINSDHNPVVMKLKIKLTKVQTKRRQGQLNLDMLKEENIRSRFNVAIQNKFDVLNVEEQEQAPDSTDTVQGKWDYVKNALHRTAQEILPRKSITKKQKWMTDDILDKMDLRRIAKNNDPKQYDKLNREVIDMCGNAKEDWMIQQCQEVEELDRGHKVKEMHNRVKHLTTLKSSKRSSGCIESKDGRILFEQKDVADRWVEYIAELYDDERQPLSDNNALTGKAILKSEVKAAIRAMKRGKATGPDEISAEVLAALDSNNLNIITEICNDIYHTGFIPKDMRQSIFVPIPKKPNAHSCSDFRTISLMSHMTKLLLKIIQKRVIAKIDQEISIFQSGFRPRIGTREGIFNLRIICERIIELGQDVFICFIDYKKAFDKVKHSKLMECLKEIGIDETDLRTIAGLYWDQTAVVRTKTEFSSEFSIKRGVRQGCVLSPNLFNLYTEKIFKEVIDRNGVNIGGMNINNLRYADDTALIALNAADLQTLLDKVNTCGKPYGMEMNIVKTKSMVVSKTAHK